MAHLEHRRFDGSVRSMVYIAVGGVFMNARGSYAIFAPICTSNAQRLYMHSVGAVRHGVLWYGIMCGMVCFVMVSYAMLSYAFLWSTMLCNGVLQLAMTCCVSMSVCVHLYNLSLALAGFESGVSRKLNAQDLEQCVVVFVRLNQLGRPFRLFLFCQMLAFKFSSFSSV